MLPDSIGTISKGWLTPEYVIGVQRPDLSDPIIVLGLPRSGTSRIAGLLHIMGIYMGARFPPTNKDNPRGFYEDKDLTELVDSLNMEYVNRDEFTTILKYIFILRKSLGSRWGFKTHRITKELDIVHALCPDAKIIVCTREYQATARSIARVYNMPLESAYTYTQQMNGEIQDILNKKDNCLLIELEKSIQYDMETIKAIVNYSEIKGLSQTDLDRAMYYLTFYKNYEHWPSEFAPKE